jgi:CBS domain containing-hemolysin-like protein
MDDDRSGARAAPTPVSEPPQPASSDPGKSFWSRLKGVFGNGRDTSLRESLEEMIDQHGAEGGNGKFRPEARLMMLKLVEFADLRVDDVMVPRADIIAIDAAAPLSALLDIFADANHSRLPVYREILDDPIGMIHIKDVMRWITERSSGRTSKSKTRKPLNLTQAQLDTPVKDLKLVREMLFVPPSMPAADLLVKMQSTRIHMAIVVDEYGGTDGLVSIEDVMEEIVGEISDEHDEDEELQLTPAGNGVLLADARADIEDVEKALGVDLLPDDQEEDADTLGGLIFTMLGRVPVRGELIPHSSGLEFEIVEADPRRVKKLKIHTRKCRAADVSTGDISSRPA